MKLQLTYLFILSLALACGSKSDSNKSNKDAGEKIYSKGYVIMKPNNNGEYGIIRNFWHDDHDCMGILFEYKSSDSVLKNAKEGDVLFYEIENSGIPTAKNFMKEDDFPDPALAKEVREFYKIPIHLSSHDKFVAQGGHKLGHIMRAVAGSSQAGLYIRNSTGTYSPKMANKNFVLRQAYLDGKNTTVWVQEIDPANADNQIHYKLSKDTYHATNSTSSNPGYPILMEAKPCHNHWYSIQDNCI